METVDCVIVGGGPAGLNAALVLGRARRSVAVFDEGRPRNAVTRHTHGFITRDGIAPEQFRKLAWQELGAYPSVSLRRDMVMNIVPARSGFVVQTGSGAETNARKLLLAGGLKERLPVVPGLERFYGNSLYSCPYCDGWELRDQPLIVVAEGEGAFRLARLAYQWSRDLLLCTNGTSPLTIEEYQKLRNRGITVTKERIVELLGADGHLCAVRFESGACVARKGGFISPYWRQSSPLGASLGCALNAQGGINTDHLGRTSVYGVFAAGDSSVIAPAQAVIAAGEGSRAAIGINADLIQEDF